MTRFLVGTRKGLFRITRQADGRWALENLGFLGDPVPMVYAQEGGRRLLASLDLGHFGAKMHRSEDGGASWSEVPLPAYPPQPDGLEEIDPVRGLEVPWVTKLAWCFAAGDAGELWCGTIPGGLFRSTDDGLTWELQRALWDRPERLQWSGGGFDFAGIHLDCVEQLGDYLELEVVLEEGEAPAAGEGEAQELMAALGILTSDLVEGAYADLLPRQAKSSAPLI